jgi:hypothetical protein
LSVKPAPQEKLDQFLSDIERLEAMEDVGHLSSLLA